ncbi:hypothetical protein, partial [Amphritea pacifica]|uniref:hypothetical protein n=1 Tax=Amphritea pacifica TaxID=2811233 RepID=UPI0019625B5C
DIQDTARYNVRIQIKRLSCPDIVGINGPDFFDLKYACPRICQLSCSDIVGINGPDFFDLKYACPRICAL